MTGPEYAYAAFGLTVLCNRRLAGLLPARAHAGRTVRIHVSERCVGEVGAPTAPPDVTAGYERLWRTGDGSWLLRYEDAKTGQAWSMRLESDGGRIDVQRTAGVAVEDVLQIVQTVGLSTALQLAGTVVLHGSAIELDGRAIIVLGPSGAGKSTTAAAFLVSGHALLSDDIAAIQVVHGEPVVHAGMTQLRVTPKTANAVGWDPQRLPRVFETEILGDKRRVMLSESAGSFCAQARPIAGVYVLRTRGAREQGASPEVTAISPPQAVPLLLANCYRLDRLDSFRRAHLLSRLASLAQDIPVRRVRAADDLESLPLLLDALT